LWFLKCNDYFQFENRIDTHVALLAEDAAKLTSLPLEIRETPAHEIINYVIDLLNAPVALFRTKLMVVGYERVGKTSLLECLFPFTTTSYVICNLASTKEDAHQPQSVILELVGKELRINPSPTPLSRQQPATLPGTTATTVLNLREGKWTVSSPPKYHQHQPR